MLTIQDMGSEAVYKAALQEIKKNLPLAQKLFKSGFSAEEASALQKLEIRKTSLDDLEFLRFFPQLKDFRLEFVTGLADISGLRYCPDLKEFEMVNSDVASLEEVACCQGLTYFCYSLEEDYKQYGKSDFTFLKRLPELEVICITGNRLADVSVLSNLQKVNHLVLEDNPITTIAPLKNMRSLKQLELEYCGLTQLEDLGEFKALKTLFLEGNLFTEAQKAEYRERYSHIEMEFEY